MNSLAILWLGLSAFFCCDGLCSIPGWRTKILKATWYNLKKKKRILISVWSSKETCLVAWVAYSLQEGNSQQVKESQINSKFQLKKLVPIKLSPNIWGKSILWIEAPYSLNGKFYTWGKRYTKKWTTRTWLQNNYKYPQNHESTLYLFINFNYFILRN